MTYTRLQLFISVTLCFPMSSVLVKGSNPLFAFISSDEADDNDDDYDDDNDDDTNDYENNNDKTNTTI